jgi:hypothetical protein
MREVILRSVRRIRMFGKALVRSAQLEQLGRDHLHTNAYLLDRVLQLKVRGHEKVQDQTLVLDRVLHPE